MSKATPLSRSEAKDIIDADLKSSPVFLYMKGDPVRPMCGSPSVWRWYWRQIRFHSRPGTFWKVKRFVRPLRNIAIGRPFPSSLSKENLSAVPILSCPCMNPVSYKFSLKNTPWFETIRIQPLPNSLFRIIFHPCDSYKNIIKKSMEIFVVYHDTATGATTSWASLSVSAVVDVFRNRISWKRRTSLRSSGIFSR